MRTPTHQTDRRSGVDRRAEDATDADSDPRGVGVGPGRVTRWPLDVDPDWARPRPRDPWAEVVQRSIDAYRSGRIHELGQTWDDAIRWRVSGGRGRPLDADPAAGPDGVFAYHRELLDRSDGTFRQRLISLEGSLGPIVEAHLRTTASRGEQTLDIPSLIVFELSASRIREVKEVPGDCAAWDAFWSD
jgi:hypothetical protein